MTPQIEFEEALQELNTSLEAQVAERTVELQQRAAELEAALAESQEAQERLVRSERLAASVAHELRDPLSTIRTSAYYLKRKLSEAEDRVRDSLEQIEKETVASNRIIHELLEFSRTHPSELHPGDVNEVVQAAMARTSFPRGVTVATHLAKELPRASLDAHQLERVFLNLITNATQAMPEGGELVVRTWLDRGVRKQGDQPTDQPTIVISISDTGEGIPPEDQERIFEPLFTTKVHGTGLGLAICRRIVEAHSGSIEVKSRVGKGSMFAVRLPVVSSQ